MRWNMVRTHLQHLIPVVVDDLDGDLAGLWRIEGAANRAEDS